MIHFQPPPNQKACDLAKRREIHARLENEIEEQRVSAELVSKHNERIIRSTDLSLSGVVPDKRAVRAIATLSYRQHGGE